jgi:RNA polymerase sigma-70 factor (ECF subfamily)
MAYDQDTELYLEYGRTGDARTFQKLFERYGHKVLNSILFMTGADQAAAEDLTQEIFVKVVDERQRFKPQAKFSTWLHTLTRHRVLNYLRDRKDTVDVTETSLPSLAPGALEKLEQHDRERAVKAALQRLSEQQRSALVLREYEGKSYADIAVIMELSVSAVESLIFHARQNMRKILEGIEL